MPAQHGQCPLKSVGLRGVVGVQHAPCFFLVDMQSACQFNPGNTSLPHFQVKRSFKCRLNRDCNQILTPFRLTESGVLGLNTWPGACFEETAPIPSATAHDHRS